MLRNRSYNPPQDESETNSTKTSIQIMKIKDYRDRSLNAERRTSSPLKLSLQHIPGGLNKTPSA